MTPALRQSDPEPALLARATGGDTQALEKLLEEVYPRVFEWALVQCGDEDEASDLTQDTLVRLVRHLPSYRGEGSFLGWVFTVTRNLALEGHRKRSRRRKKLEGYRMEMTETHTSPERFEDRIAQGKVAGLVRDFFMQLPARQREVFALADLEGFTSTEIARMLSLKPVTVRAHLFRARRAVRRKILDNHPELAGEVADALS